MDTLNYFVKDAVLVIDGTSADRALCAKLLGDAYEVKVADTAEKGLRIAASSSPPDLILLDTTMPGIDSYEICRRLKGQRKTQGIPVILLSPVSNPAEEKKGLALGAADYIVKPISPALLIARVSTHLALKASVDFLRSKNDFLAAEVKKRTKELEDIQEVMIFAIASLAEKRDLETGKHVLRTQRYVKALAEKLRSHPRFAGFLNDRTIRILYQCAPLHDIGKVGIPDRILLKPGRYEAHELEIMKNHTRLGHHAIQIAEDWLGKSAEFLTIAKEITLYHQEKWDGTGYPEALAGESIPVSARLMALADVYDALISRRVYQDRMSHETAAQVIVEGSGSHFDPDVVDAFVAIQEQFRVIAERFPDSDGDLQQKIEFLAQAVAVDAGSEEGG